MYPALFTLLDSPQFSPFIQHYGYIGIFIWFITFDQITPFPEEISLIIVGYLSALGAFNPILAAACSLLGFFTIDTIYFLLAKKGSSFIRKKTKGLSKIMERYRQRIKKHSLKAFFVLCFIPRMRLFAPILAGTSDYTYKRFFMLDATALVVFAIIYVSLGYFFSKSLSHLISKVNGLQNIIFVSGIAMVAAVVIVFIIRRNNKSRNKD